MSEKHSSSRLKASSLTTIVSISLVLFMLGLLGIIIINTQKISDNVKENIGFQVILKEDIKDENLDKLQGMLQSAPFVKSTEYISKDDAAKKLKEDLGEDFINFLGFNPLSASIVVHLKAQYANNDSIVWIEKQISAFKQVKEVSYQKDLVTAVNKNVQKISLFILAFTAVLMFIALALINNTIRLSIYSKRFLIKTMQLVGATTFFIRRPFIFTGIKHGIYGAFVAIALLMGVLYLVEKQVPELTLIQDYQSLEILFGGVLILGMLIAWISTSLAVTKYLRLKSDELYY